jgi:hypothetical protein
MGHAEDMLTECCGACVATWPKDGGAHESLCFTCGVAVCTRCCWKDESEEFPRLWCRGCSAEGVDA